MLAGKCVMKYFIDIDIHDVHFDAEMKTFK